MKANPGETLVFAILASIAFGVWMGAFSAGLTAFFVLAFIYHALPE